MADINQIDLEISGNKFKHIARSIPAEKLSKKWSEVPERPTPSSEELQKMLMLENRLSMAKNAKEKKHDLWNFSYMQYRSVNHYSMLYGGYPTYWNQWGMGVFIPRTFETVESVKVGMMGRTPDFMVTATRPSTNKYSQNLYYLTKSEYRRSHTQREVAETVHDVLVYGTGIVRTDLIDDVREEWKLTWKTNEEGKKVVSYEKQNVQKYYGVGSRRIDPYDFYPNPSPEAYRRDKLGWAFERSIVDAWDLREQYKVLKETGAHGVTDNWQYIKPGGDLQDYKYLRREVDSLYSFVSDTRTPSTISDLVGRSMPMSMEGNQTKDKVEVWEYWEDDRYIVIANGLILRDSPNPYPHKLIPYVKYNLIDMNEFWSMGIPEYIRWLQICENILYDQGLNNIIMSVHKMFAVNSRYIEDEGELVARPFGIIHLKQIPNVRIQDAIMPIEYSHNMNNYFEFMRLNSQNIQTVTGVSPYQTGGVTSEAQTDRATVANRLAFAGSARIREIARHLENDLVAGIVEDYVAIIQFYYQNNDAFEDGFLTIEVDEPGKNYYMKYVPNDSADVSKENLDGFQGIITQDEIQGGVRVSVSGGSSLPKNPEDLAKLKMDFARFAQEAVVVDPMTQQPTPVFNLKKVAEEVAKEVFEIADPADYLYNSEQQPQEQMMQQTQMQQEPVSSGSPPVEEDFLPTNVPGEDI